jgi:hypothetical protein
VIMQHKHVLAGKHARLRLKTLYEFLDFYNDEVTVLDYYSQLNYGISWKLSPDPICTEYMVRTLGYKHLAKDEKVVVVIYKGKRMLVHESEIEPLPRKEEK